MGAVIHEQALREALRPWLGSPLLEETTLVAECAHLLRSYAPYREDFEGLQKRLESYLFAALHALLGSAMTVRLDNGYLARIYVKHIPLMADDAMGVLFDSLAPYSVNFEALKAHSMATGSLSAMRVLWQKYDAFQPPEEKELMARIIRENHPSWRYRSWLEEA